MPSAKTQPKQGLFHSIDDTIRELIVKITVKDAAPTPQRHKGELERQAIACRRKEEIMKEKHIQKISEDYIDALYYFEMHESEACWRGDDPNIVDKELAKITSQSEMRHACKENINI